MPNSPQYVVSIHLGASAFSLLISQLIGEKSEQVEYLEQPVPLARDIFSSERVRRDTIERCVEILDRFLLLIEEFGLNREQITICAVTNIIHEAKNHHVILNRLEVASGLKFIALDNGGMTRLIFQKFQRHQLTASFNSPGKTLAAHVGPGNTRILLLNNGKVERYSTYRLGSHRTAVALSQAQVSGSDYLSVIQAHCDPLITSITYDYRNEEIDSMILIGAEIQRVERENDRFKIGRNLDQFQTTLKDYAEMTEDERIRAFHLDYHSEDAFLPALQINLGLLRGFNCQQYWIPPTEYERGLLMDLPLTQSRTHHFAEETLHAAKLLAQRYNADPHHYEQVLALVESFFLQTKAIHQLGDWELFLLKIAAIVHEIGGYISSRMHHKHSYYLISNSEIFGLEQNSLEIIALVSRYHRQSPPKHNHKEYRNLSRSDQVLVSKLSALLRVADALDVTQQQRIKKLTVTQRKEHLLLSASGPLELNLEKISLKQKGNLFEELFGLELHLQTSSGT